MLTLTRCAKTALAATVAAAIWTPGAATAQEACTTYEVQPGDSLGTIAFAAYGTYDYQLIFNANRNTVGPSPNNLQVGSLLTLPCEDGALNDGQSLDQIIQQQRVINQARRSDSTGYKPPIRMVSGSNWAPFSDESLDGGGFVPILARTAMERGGNTRPYSLHYVNDWGSHLETLLPTGAFDVTMAWFTPDCDKYDMLSGPMRDRCDNFLASVPVYEPVQAYFTRAGSEYANITSFDQLKGARVCRMEGYSTNDLEEEGLAPPDITYINPTLPEECIEAVLFGNADITNMELQSGTDAITKLGVSAEVVEIPSLAKVLSLSFMAHRSNPNAREFITMLNRGLNEMRETGEWYAIVSNALNEHNKMLLSQ